MSEAPSASSSGARFGITDTTAIRTPWCRPGLMTVEFHTTRQRDEIFRSAKDPW